MTTIDTDEFRSTANSGSNTVAVASPPQPAVTNNKSDPRSTWAILGFVRIVLASVVMCGHWRRTGYGDISVALSSSAFVSVVAFFLISGYCIAASLTREPSHFYARRFIRIWPVLITGVLMSLLPYLCFGPVLRTHLPNLCREPNWLVVVGSLLCLQALVTPIMDTLTASWSLNCEIIYYALAPYLRNNRLVVGLTIGSFVCYAGYTRFINPTVWNAPGGSAAICLAWAWLAGFLYYRNRQPWAAALVAMATPFLLLIGVIETAATVALLAGASAVVLFAHKVQLPRPMVKIGEYLGDVSYPLYLIHQPVIFMCYFLGLRGLAPAVALMAAAVVLQVVDRPARKALSRALIPVKSSISKVQADGSGS